MSLGRASFPSLRRRGVRAVKKWYPFRKRRGRGGRSQVTLLVSDHPVCGVSVATRLFIDAAATPPLQGGECAPLNSSTTHSHLLKPATTCSQTGRTFCP